MNAATGQESASPNYVSGSFRDPSGRLIQNHARVLRAVYPSGQQDLRAFFESKAAREMVEAGHIISSRIIEEPAGVPCSLAASLPTESMVIEHEAIPFPSYPAEWPSRMLHRACELTLEVARRLLPDGLGLKDATPYNVLFRGSQPVFVDIGSFERRTSGDPVWLAYSQFVRTFLIPLAANKFVGTPLDQIFLTRADGLEPVEIYEWLTPLARVRSPFLTLVSIPKWLTPTEGPEPVTFSKKVLSNPERAEFILNALFDRLARQTKRLRPKPAKTSLWSSYMDRKESYTDTQFGAKHLFVSQAVAEFRPQSVLDIGCNTGHFSLTCAEAGSKVVAIDSDPVVADALWSESAKRGLNILPLVVNIARPTPAMGWRNAECSAFLDRAKERFDAVLMLAVLHHLLVTNGIPLCEVVDLAAELTKDLLIIEFVGPGDKMFQRLTRGRDRLHEGLNEQMFLSECLRKFQLIRMQHLEDSCRSIYLLRKRHT